MAWYRTGTVTVTNGSATVTGAGTDFVSNTQIGECFLGPDGRVYEIAAVVSSTQLTIIPAYQGSTAGAQAFGIQPTSSFARDLAFGVGQLLNGFAAVRDGVGQGLFQPGTVAAPGVRNAGDQDTGIYWPGQNAVGIAVGGVTKALINSDGLTMSNGWVNVTGDQFGSLIVTRNNVGSWFLGGSGVAGDNTWNIRYNNASMLKVDNSGNMLVGTTTGLWHTIQGTSAANGAPIVGFTQPGLTTAAIYVVDYNGVESANAANSAMKIGKSGSGRSLATSGTINASGADYAEYMVKAQGCGTITPGEICGVNSNSLLTRNFAASVSFVVKSTDPAYVGGDTWAVHLPEPPAREEDETDAAYATRRAPWEQQLESARQTVDRIAFAGQVPCNVAAGSFEPGDYIVAGPGPNDTIVPVVVKAVDMTFGDYTKRIGKVWRVMDDGRAWIDVQHG